VAKKKKPKNPSGNLTTETTHTSTTDEQAKKFEVSEEEYKQLQEKTKFTKEELKQLYALFVSINPSGKIDKERFKPLLKKLEKVGIKEWGSTPFIDRLFELVDANSDGLVDFQEFVAGMSWLAKANAQEKIQVWFKIYDYEDKGSLSKEDFAKIFKIAWMHGYNRLQREHPDLDLATEQIESFSIEAANELAEEIMACLDSKGEGKITLNQFKRFASCDNPTLTVSINHHEREVKVI